MSWSEPLRENLGLLFPPGWGILLPEGFGSNTSDRSAAVEEGELITFDASRRHADFRFAPYELLMPCVIFLFCGALQKPVPPGQTGGRRRTVVRFCGVIVRNA